MNRLKDSKVHIYWGKLLVALVIICLSVDTTARQKEVTIEKESSKAALENERAKQEERDQLDTRTIEEVARSTRPDRFTQTEAHLYLPHIRKLISKNYDVEPYLNVVATVVANEAKYKDTHYAFYNTTSNVWRLAQDLYTRLYAHFNVKKIGSGFKFLRFNDESINATAQGFLVRELKEKGLVDDNTETGAILLSVNLALFGNVGYPGECSWEYFEHPQGHKSPSRETFEVMMDKFELTHKYIGEIMSLFDIYDTKQDTIVQVLVPKNKIDEIGYLAWVKGIPAHPETIEWIQRNAKSASYLRHVKPLMEKLTARFEKEKEKNPLYRDMMESVKAGDFSLDSFLKVYRNKPWEIEEINDVTARLLFTPDVLLNPESGVKFFRYSTVEHKKLQEYNKQLNRIIDKIIDEKEAKGAMLDDKRVAEIRP